MFIYSAKMDKKKLATILVCLAVVAIVLILVFTRSCGGANNSADPSNSGLTVTEPDTDTDELRRAQLKMLKKARIKSSEDAYALLTQLGWTVEPEPAECMEVTIPEEFSDVYTKYNELQKTQGFDLSEHAGKTAMRWTYLVTNHPSGEEEAYATLLVINNRLVGGDVCSARLDGFMHGLLPSYYMPDTSTSSNEEEPDADVSAETTSVEDADAEFTDEVNASPANDLTSGDTMLPSN